jgi:ATP-dependent Clp protease ATP-binding subunit ClpC
VNRRFQPVYVPEPSVDETYQILLGLRERYEAHHKLRYTDEALDAAAKYSHQYISDRCAPADILSCMTHVGNVATICAILCNRHSPVTQTCWKPPP